ncbi:unnamed protein product [Pseudo-nitzschia multistriata]|uniref:Major facilitator superfamily (MFS) profile domain-containing protein n=1 Tax=Pseudo-nitzschia multistriata TaxID=183589 RepID=A0A448ZER0_9STRA|nr:unnamed protein product [Pseudo-nitzschia multistriata]
MTTTLSEDATAGTSGGIGPGETDVDGAGPSSPTSLSMEPTPTGDSLFNTIAGVMGNVLEWYDFALFGFFSDVIAEIFFPPAEEGSYANLIDSFVIFGSAFLMRPIGGLLIGYVGDKHGRKEALTKSLFLMAIPTTLMGCLPTYQQVGPASTVLLSLCRLVQGVSVGGQLPASLVYTVEKRPRSQWGYYGSLPMMAANIGTLLGNLCGALMRALLTEEQLMAWGWRLPFLSGILIAFVACYLRKYGGEVATPGDKPRHHNPIKVALLPENRLALLSTAVVPMLWAAGFYVSFVWMSIYMEDLMEPPVPEAFWVNSLGLLLGMTWVLPVAGSISDRVGRIPIMTASGLLLAALGPVCLILISKGNPFVAVASQLVLGTLLSFFGGPLCAWLVESFSPEVRMTSASIGYDVSHAIAGGFSPAIATALYTSYGTAATGLVYVIFGLLSVAGLYFPKCCGRADKESDTGGTPGGAGEVEMPTPAEGENKIV